MGDRGGLGGLDGVEADGEAQGVGLADDALQGAVRVAPGEVVPAQVVVVDVVGEYVPDRGQDGVLEGDDRFLFPQPGDQVSAYDLIYRAVYGLMCRGCGVS
ncbi:MAG: hypothetical protein M3460_31065 [Actinomycetota bacterium]|nr:hypothetical protein [Actinomycetota bacterium]